LIISTKKGISRFASSSFYKDKSSLGLDELNRPEVIKKWNPSASVPGSAECLPLQMEQSGRDVVEIELIRNHWNDLLENHLPYIAKKCSVERIRQAIERMSKLDISPAYRSIAKNHPITADVIVEPDGAGGYQVYSAETRMPNLRSISFTPNGSKPNPR
jgi:DNA-directed RNA polymerase specialized sigma54-like protein